MSEPTKDAIDEGWIEQRRVVCAANLLSNGKIITGARHWDHLMRQQFEAIRNMNPDPCSITEKAQGFIDQHGVFMDRKEALKVALMNGQRLYRCGGDDHQLYSENLY